jgi:hypothetical protein
VIGSPNQAQIEHWNGPQTQRWVREQERLDRVFDQLDDVAYEAKYGRSRSSSRRTPQPC